MIEALAAEAAQHWGGTVLRLIRNRENAVFAVMLPTGARPFSMALASTNALNCVVVMLVSAL